MTVKYYDFTVNSNHSVISNRNRTNNSNHSVIAKTEKIKISVYLKDNTSHIEVCSSERKSYMRNKDIFVLHHS